jgi:hypothetical protein
MRCRQKAPSIEQKKLGQYHKTRANEQNEQNDQMAK